MLQMYNIESDKGLKLMEKKKTRGIMVLGKAAVISRCLNMLTWEQCIVGTSVA